MRSGAGASPASRPHTAGGGHWWHVAASVVVLLTGGLLSFVVSSAQQRQLDQAVAVSLASATRSVTDDIGLHLSRYADLAAGLQGLYAASEDVSHDEFLAFTAPRTIQPYRALTAVGVLEPTGGGLRVLRGVDADGEVGGSGLAGVAAKLDSTIAAATDTGQPVTSPAVVGAGGERHVAIVAALYRSGRPTRTAAQRAAAVTGWAVVVLRPDRLLDDVVFRNGVPVGVALFDGSSADATLVAARPPDLAAPEGRRIAVPVAGGLWTMRLRPLPGFGARPGDTGDAPKTLWLVGMLLSALLAALTWTLGRSKNAALRIVADTTADLRNSEQRFRSLAAASPLGVFRLTATGDCEYANKRLCRLSGREEADLLGDGLLDAIHPSDRAALREAWAGDGGASALQVRLCHPDGTTSWVRTHAAPLTSPAGSVTGWVGSVEDVTAEFEARQASERLSTALAHQARHDHLTGLPNRAYFTELLDEHLANASPDRPVALLFFDLDRFKVVNDSLGHDAGDRLLVAVAERLRGALAATDVAARFGGDEFVICLPAVDGVSGAELEAERIIGVLTAPLRLADRDLSVTASMGVAVTERALPADDLLTQADTAMYDAKANGKARVEVYGRRPAARTTSSLLDFEHDLRRAVEDNTLTLVYQPMVAIDSGMVVGAEALVRWTHPVRGPISPTDFIPLAEDAGLIIPLGTEVLRQACRQLRTWQDTLPRVRQPSMTVNVSARQLGDPAFGAIVAAALADSGANPSSLCLELTESAFLSDMDAAALRDVRALGVRIAVDDFGTGYSSLTHLKHLPVDMLKIDRSFVTDVGDDMGNTAIVGAVVRLARALGMTSVAEGVEERRQLDWLASLGCDLAQGYYLARPTDAEAVRDMLSRGLGHFSGCSPSYSGAHHY